MRKSVTQEFDYGCGIACFAFALKLTYTEAAGLLGPEQSISTRFWVKDFVEALHTFGNIAYTAKYIKPHLKSKIYQEGTIVLIRRSKIYPSGHYLIRHHRLWMDPWINLPADRDITNAKSGYRSRLPGSPMYAIFPEP